MDILYRGTQQFSSDMYRREFNDVKQDVKFSNKAEIKKQRDEK